MVPNNIVSLNFIVLVREVAGDTETVENKPDVWVSEWTGVLNTNVRLESNCVHRKPVRLKISAVFFVSSRDQTRDTLYDPSSLAILLQAYPGV